MQQTYLLTNNRGGDSSSCPSPSMSTSIRATSGRLVVDNNSALNLDAKTMTRSDSTDSLTNKKSSKDLWFLHGKYYDLTEFIASHPGGSAILKMSKGLEDATPLMESYHAFANKEYIASILAKYEVAYTPEDAETRTKTQTTYTFEPNGFYSTLTRRVRKHFGSVKENESITKKVKANRWWAIKVTIQSLVFLACYVTAFFMPMDGNENEFKIRAALACIAGVFIVALGMTAMHDGSHYAIGARDSWKNKLALRVWTSIAVWDASKWLYHHTVRHHSFTSDSVLDPDTMHAKPFVRKHLSTSRSKYFSFPKALETERWFWAIYAVLIYILAPGMYIGQVISYRILWPLKGRLWRMPSVPKGAFEKYLWEDMLTLAVFAPHIYLASPLVTFAFFTACNIAYAICIVPDHDTYESAIQNHVEGGKIDWGEIQARHSSDFGSKGFLGRCFTEMFGGINVQIGHHLFPSLSHVHLAKVAPIIRETCEEFNIPYADQGSVLTALWSFVRTIHACMGKESGADEVKAE